MSTTQLHTIAIAGNPNSGKTTVFNALTGLQQKVGNYPGVTVEKKTGQMTLPSGTVEVIDLPGLYSLNPKSIDEQVAFDVLTGREKGTAMPDGVVVVIDASNLERNLFLFTQIMDLEIPTILALNMMDVVERRHIQVDLDKLSATLGVPVVPLIAKKGKGIEELKAAIQHLNQQIPPKRQWNLHPEVESACESLTKWFAEHTNLKPGACFSQALYILTNDSALELWGGKTSELRERVFQLRESLKSQEVNWKSAEITGRYTWVRGICQETLRYEVGMTPHKSDKLDQVLIHPVAGPLIFIGMMALVFQSIYSWASFPMDIIDGFFGWLSGIIHGVLPEGVLQGLIVDGVIGGVGNVVIFLPQILLLFFFLALLEDSGYMPRAALMMDGVMRKFGLQGKAVVPLLSSFACAIPGIMATRTIENQRDRLLTILIAPLMSCSARMPVYVIFIGTFIPNQRVLGIFTVAGLTLLGMYLTGIVAAILMAILFRKWLVKGEAPAMIIELPSYRLPSLKSALILMWVQSRAFLVNAGTIILTLTIVLWALATYPQVEQYSVDYPTQIRVLTDQLPAAANPDQLAMQIQQLEAQQAAEDLAHSFAGRLGKVIEPVIEPLGYDWKLGVGIIAAFAAREVMVSTLGTIYSIGDADEESTDLREHLRQDYSTLTAVSVMVFFVLACQCMSTLAVVRRETGSWKWPLFMFGYMSVLAYIGALVVYQGGQLLGWGG